MAIQRTSQILLFCIANTDCTSQFTSFAWTGRLKRIRISMDGKSRCLDNIFIQRLWRSLTYAWVYPHAWETGSQAKAGIGRWIAVCNPQRHHPPSGGEPPATIHLNRTGGAERSLICPGNWLPKFDTSGAVS
ncbi:putative transposase OrfB [Jannaschia seosinensis]|uniref:Putative transposase OrfB n=1 Tax=Jannaschia seosinensis TaxID=313367 RepID=A0A0M7BC10_9RHOB|nr:putative transposase OrfB [Jannaschia seosinensis]